MTRSTADQKSQPPAQLLALLDIVGPAEAPALLAQLQADLTGCDNQLQAATPTCDWLAIRRASHNLIALAGTAGANRLQRIAEDLNRIAQTKDRAALSTVGPATRTELAALTQLIRNMAENRGRP